MTIDASNTALILEGGGMRACYTAAVVDKLLEKDVRFGWVGGISAGASHTVSYLTGERDRVRSNFVDFALDPQFGGPRHLMRGNGYFNAEYIYGRAPTLNLPRPYDVNLVHAHPATQFRISAVNAHTGEAVYWGREDIHDAAGLMHRVRASSTLPLLMPIPSIDGVPYVDGALGPSGGIPLDAAEFDGFEKFFVVLTHPQGYRKPPVAHPKILRMLLSRYPVVAQRLIEQHHRYNRTLDRLLQLETEGRAYLFWSNGTLVSSTERDFNALLRSFQSGESQAAEEWPKWEKFLGR